MQVLDEGSTIVILADVYGTAGNMATDYEPEQEWQSTDGGATWLEVNNGLSVTSGIINADTGPLSAVTVPGTGVLGYGWDTASGPPTFNAFPLSSPPECSATQPGGCPAGYATLEPDTNPDTLGNEAGHFASQTGASPGVMGVFDSLFTNGPLGCSQSFGTAYVYGSGDQSADEQLQHLSRPAEQRLEGRAGAGRLQRGVLDRRRRAERLRNPGGQPRHGLRHLPPFRPGNDALRHTRGDRRLRPRRASTAPSRRMATAGSTPPTSRAPAARSTCPTAPTAARASPPAALNANSDGGAGNLSSAVNAAGQGWAAWTDNGSVFASSFQAVDAISSAKTSGGATSNGSTVTVNVTCAAFPCTVTIVLTAPETVVVHAASVAHKKRGSKTLTLGKGTITIKTKGGKKLTFKLSGAARRLLEGKKGHFKVSALISTQIEHHTTKVTKTLTLTFKPNGKK